MKNILLLIPLVLFVSCVQPKTEWEKQLEAEKQEKELLQKQYADSTVSLSFCGIKLGEPFKTTVNAAKKEGTIKTVKYNDGSATCKANIYIPNREEPVVVDVKVCSYQDTITSFLILSDVYETKEAIKHLYKERYNEKAAVIDDDAEYWDDNVYRSGHTSQIWTFKNQSINLSEFYEEKRENYVKDARMRSPENRYGVKYTKYFKALSIIYSDTKQCEKAQAYEDEIAAKQKAAQKVIDDELKAKIEAQITKQQERAANQDI